MKFPVKIVGKFLILFALISGAIFLSPNSFQQNVCATAGDCAECQRQYESCFTLPPGPQRAQCLQAARYCFSRCDNPSQ